jgi:D-glycerate 3-kinase
MNSQFGQTAEVSREVFHRLDKVLARFLAQGAATLDLAALGTLVARNPIEAGPLRALGSDGGEADLRERLEILSRVYPALKAHKDALDIAATLLPETFEIYIPVARFLLRRSLQIRARHGRAAVFGINGGQGSGKTTINAFLQVILSRGLGRRVAGLSIDDVYKGYEQRQEMGRTVHPLFAIRSVAGTHDTALAVATLNALMHAEPGSTVAIPRFDKMAKGGQGDRLPESEWPRVQGPLDIVIFEGWCVGARPQPPGELAVPVNRREADEDPDATWRRTMNQLLATDYRTLFDRLDDLLVIQVRSMEDVFRNRELQERHLRRRLEEARRRGEDTGERGAMSPREVVDFISLYERTTRHMLATLPDLAGLTLYIGDHHRIERLRVNTPPSW